MAVPNQSRRRNELKFKVTDEVMEVVLALQEQYCMQHQSDACNLMMERAAFGLAGKPASSTVPTVPTIRCNVPMDKQFVLTFFGGVTKTAEALGIKPSSVSEWTDHVPLSAIGRIALNHPKALSEWRKLQATKKAA